VIKEKNFVEHAGLFDLNMKCPQQAHVLKAWSSAGGNILGREET
jgi:hypothetical protein